MNSLALLLVPTAICAAGNLYNEPIRPQFHFCAKANWLNDPNGLVYYKGQYHLFFQHNPSGVDWGNMTWGHAVSHDLVHWTELEPAIRPDELGTIFSGSAVVDRQNTSGLKKGDEKTICAFYTAAEKHPFAQCLAYSNDAGKTFTKYENNPVVPHIAGANRDPKVIWYAPGKHWVMALYLDGDEYAILNSPDLIHWTKESSLHFPNDSECPDLFELPVDGDAKNTKWVFVAGTGSYFIGGFDGKTFKPESGPFTGDYGANYYATQSYSDIPSSDGRRIQIAWMRGGQYPNMPFNQQMNFPCECTLKTFPEGIRMCRVPVREIEKLRTKDHKWTDVTITPVENLLSGINGELLDIDAVIDVADVEEIGFKLHGQTISYATKDQTLTSLGRSAKLVPVDNRLSLRVLLDRSSIEVYADQGKVVISNCFVPGEDHSIELYTRGGNAKIVSMNVHELKSSWQQ